MSGEGEVGPLKIKEVEEQVGITRKNIRFYEAEGLLNPRRNSVNGYREYSEEDVHVLKTVKLLRKLGVSIEEIRRMQQGELTLSDGMARHLVALKREAKNLETAEAVCRAIMEKNLALPELDPDQILTQLYQLEETGTHFMNKHKDDVRKKYIAPAMAALVVVLLMAGVMALILWGDHVDPIPLPLLLLLLALPIGCAVGVGIALRQRIHEIQGGEEDDARKY